MAIEHTLSNFIEEHFPKEVTNWKGDKGKLVITQNSENEKDYENWANIAYIGEDKMPIESRYNKNSIVYLISFYPTIEEAVIDMADRLISGGLIK